MRKHPGEMIVDGGAGISTGCQSSSFEAIPLSNPNPSLLFAALQNYDPDASTIRRTTASSAAQTSLESSRSLSIIRHKQLIRQTWNVIRFALEVDVARIFYEQLFAQHPQVHALFHGIDMQGQAQKLYMTLRAAVQLLEDIDDHGTMTSDSDLLRTLQDLGRRHGRSYGARRKYYQAVTKVFLDVVQDFLQSDPMTNSAGTGHGRVACTMRYILQVRQAWDWLLTLVGTTMADAVDQDQDQNTTEKVTVSPSIVHSPKPIAISSPFIPLPLYSKTEDHCSRRDNNASIADSSRLLAKTALTNQPSLSTFVKDISTKKSKTLPIIAKTKEEVDKSEPLHLARLSL